MWMTDAPPDLPPDPLGTAARMRAREQAPCGNGVREHHLLGSTNVAHGCPLLREAASQT